MKKNKNILFNYFTIQVPKEKRDSLLFYLNTLGIGAAIYYKKPIHLQKVILDRGKRIHLKNTENVSKSIISLPLFAFANDNEKEYIIDSFLKFK